MPNLLRMLSRSSPRQNHNAYITSHRKFKEKNILSASLGTCTVVMLCAALVEPMWFELQGGMCCHSYLGISAFLNAITSGSFEYISTPATGNKEVDCEKLSNRSESSYEYCVNAQALTLIQVISGFCFLAIATSLFSFVLDITSPQHKILWKVLKRYSFGYIFTVLLCATITGFSYWASQVIYQLQFDHKQYPGSNVQVSFSTGVYLITAGGGIAILATTSNLMRQYPTEEEEQVNLLLEEESEVESTDFSPPAYRP